MRYVKKLSGNSIIKTIDDNEVSKGDTITNLGNITAFIVCKDDIDMNDFDDVNDFEEIYEETVENASIIYHTEKIINFDDESIPCLIGDIYSNDVKAFPGSYALIALQ